MQTQDNTLMCYRRGNRRTRRTTFNKFDLSYILTLLLPHFIFYKFDIVSQIQSIFFQQQKSEYFLSLSLFSFGRFLLFLITLIKGDGF